MAITLREYSMPFSRVGAASFCCRFTKDWTSVAPSKALTLAKEASTTERPALRFSAARRSMPSNVALARRETEPIPALARSWGLKFMVVSPKGTAGLNDFVAADNCCAAT
jgi:hypothetical protein